MWNRSKDPLSCSSREKRIEELLESLYPVKKHHGILYPSPVDLDDPRNLIIHFFTFIHGANEPWGNSTTHAQYIASTVEDAKALSCSVVLVLAGWSGMTTCALVFDRIVGQFQGAEIPLHIRVYAGDPRQFYEVNPV
ncbi:hypothetical protein N7490_006895 [Penicillium lividum]|nr:hypothetical protein N7490_006895 [Penicillium lividum]